MSNLCVYSFIVTITIIIIIIIIIAIIHVRNVTCDKTQHSQMKYR
jgi:hypothetical protein